MVRIVELYLVVDSHGAGRILKSEPRNNLAFNEIYYKLRVAVPEGWGRSAGTIDMALPGSSFIEGSVRLLPPEGDK